MSCNEIWETSDGEVLSIHVMTDTHLQNAISYLRRTVSGMYRYSPTAEIASEMYERELSNAEEQVDMLIAEQDRRARGLDRRVNAPLDVGYPIEVEEAYDRE